MCKSRVFFPQILTKKLKKKNNNNFSLKFWQNIEQNHKGQVQHDFLKFWQKTKKSQGEASPA